MRMWTSGTLWIMPLSSKHDSSSLASVICKRYKQISIPSLKSLRRVSPRTNQQRALPGPHRAVSQHSPVKCSNQQWIQPTGLLFRLHFTILLQKEPWETVTDIQSQGWCHLWHSTALCAPDTLLLIPWKRTFCWIFPDPPWHFLGK